MTVSEQCEKKLLAVKQEEKSGKIYDSLALHSQKWPVRQNSTQFQNLDLLNAKKKKNTCKYMYVSLDFVPFFLNRKLFL